jgi:hypothetical protein
MAYSVVIAIFRTNSRAEAGERSFRGGAGGGRELLKSVSRLALSRHFDLKHRLYLKQFSAEYSVHSLPRLRGRDREGAFNKIEAR